MRHLPPLQCIQAFGTVLLLGCVLQAQAQTDEGGRPKITAVRHWSLGSVTRIVIESTGEFRFKTDRLQNPDRLFFDLIGASPQMGALERKGVSVIEVRDQFVKQLRVAETQHGVTRVVCDLTSTVEFTTSQLSNPDRLVIELQAPLLTRARQIESARTASPHVATLVFSAPPRSTPLRVAAPIVPDPPSPFDPYGRFLKSSFNGRDPLRVSAWASRPGPLPIPPPAEHLMASLPKGLAAKPATAFVIERPAPATLPLASTPIPPRTSLPNASEDVGLPAKRTSREDTMIRVLGLKLGRVVIDAGHGGHDAGTSSDGGLHEKDVVLDVAKRLGAMIEERLGSEVVYTRTDDRFVPLGRRAEIANEKKADLFLSIHVNSSPARVVGGVETYYLSFTTSKASLDTAMRENAGADRNIGELQDLLKKIALKDKVEESREFASCIQKSLVGLSPKAARAANDRGVKRAPFVVLIGASMPSVLAEVGFISNSRDEAQMRRPEHRQQIAEALYDGVAAYANTLSHFQVAQQQSRLVKGTTSRAR